MSPYKVVIILILGFFFPLCSCSRQIHSKDSAELDHITEDNRLSQDNYNNGMSAETNSVTRLSDAIVETTPTSEMRLSWKRRQLKKKINVGHGNNKLKGAISTKEFSSLSPKKIVVPNKYDSSPTFHVDYSAPQTHPPKNNR